MIWLVALLVAAGEVPGEPAASTATAPNESLLGGLLELYGAGSAEERARGAAALGATGDERAVAPLVHATRDADSRVRAAAISALAHFAAEAEPTIAAVALSDDNADVRLTAIEALVELGTASAARTIARVVDDVAAPEHVRNAAADRLRERFPNFVRERPPPLDESGRWLGVLGGAAFGGYTLGAVGNLGQSDSAPVIGALGGALIGGGAAFLLTHSVGLPIAQATTISSAGLWGLWTGLAAGALTSAHPDSRVVTSLGLAGELAGLVPAIVYRNELHFTAGDALTADAAGLAATSAAAGALQFLQPRDDSRAGLAVILGAGLAGVAVGTALAPELHFSSGGGLAIPELALLGGLFGVEAVTAVVPPPKCNFADFTFAGCEAQNHFDRARWGGFWLGGGLGAIGGGALAAAYATLHPADDLSLGIGALLGLAIGGGAARLSAAKSDQLDAGGAAAGLFLGGAAAVLGQPETRITGHGVALTALGAGWGLWNGLAIPAYLDAHHGQSSSPADPNHAILRLGLGLGGLAGFALAPAAGVRASTGAAATSVGAWGLWIAGFASAVNDAPTDTMLLSLLIAGDAGLGLGALLVSPALDVPPAALGLVGLYGAGGATLSALGAALLASSNGGGHPIGAATLVGTGVGLAVGAIGAATWHRGLVMAPPVESSRETFFERIPTPALTPITFDHGAGLALTWR